MIVNGNIIKVGLIHTRQNSYESGVKGRQIYSVHTGRSLTYTGIVQVGFRVVHPTRDQDRCQSNTGRTSMVNLSTQTFHR